MRHVLGMLRWVNDERYDLNDRNRIKKYLKHIVHGQPWLVTVQECRSARGLANRSGRQWNEAREYGPDDITSLDEHHITLPLNSIRKLRAAGRRGGNCLRRNDYGHHDALRNEVTQFYEVRKSGKAIAWMSVDYDSRKVIEVRGPNNDEADLPDEVLWELCRKLQVDGEEEERFLQRGVLRMFVDGAADVQKPRHIVAGYRLWSRRHEIVMHDSKDGGWSRFL